MSIRKIQEEFLTGIKGFYHSKGYVEIYVNPTEAEMLQASVDDEKFVGIRFIADGREKKVYAFSAGEIHALVLEKLGLSNRDYASGFDIRRKLLMGTARREGGVWTMVDSDSIESMINAFPSHAEQYEKDYLHMVFNTDWSWVNKWININRKMSEFKKEYESELKMNEAFVKDFTRSIDSYKASAFVNPTKMEMNKAANGKNVLRFTAFGKSKELYIWDSHYLHMIAMERLGKDENSEPSFSGTIRKKPNTTMWEFDDSDRAWYYTRGSKTLPSEDIKFLKSILDTDWTWLEKYFNLNEAWQETMNKLENSYEDYAPSIRNEVKKLTKKKR
jgi:hypothetical protein